jgi:hypothetical protein
MRSVEKVIDTIRGRRAVTPPAPADPQPSAASDSAPSSPRSPEIEDDVAQLHLAATVAAADGDDT